MKDLHIHTVYSDGELTIEEVLEVLKQRRIDFYSITDHDTILGNEKIIKNNLHRKYDNKFLSGIELSAKIDRGNCHILGYNIDIDNKYLLDKLLELKEMNRYNVLLVVNYLKENFDIKLTDENIKTIFNKEGSTNNVQLSKLLVNLGYCQDIREAFDKYIKVAKAKVKSYKHEFSPSECIKMIKLADGVPVLAHNYQLKMSYQELRDYIIILKRYGLMGIECYHSGFSAEGVANSLKIANDLDLLITGGSDYHGPNVKPDIEIGTGKNDNLCINELSIEKFLSKKLKY